MNLLLTGLLAFAAASSDPADDAARSGSTAGWTMPSITLANDIQWDILNINRVGAAPEQEEGRVARQGSDDRDFGLNAGAHARYSFPFGYADREVYGYTGPWGTYVLVESDVSWADLFDPGWAIEFEVDLFMRTERSMGGVMRYGGYAAFSAAHYEGETIADDYGMSFRTGDLEMATLIVGGKVVQPFSPNAFVDGRFGMGVVHYSSVTGYFQPLIGSPLETEFLEETWTLAWEVRGHGGLKLGPVGFVAGLGLGFMIPPSDGDFIDLSGGLLWTFDIDFGVEVGF